MTIKELKEFINRLPDTFNDYEVENAEYMGSSSVGGDSEDVKYRLDKPVVAIYVREDTKELLLMNAPMEQYKNEGQMKLKIKQVAKQAALALVFENVQKIPMIEITIAAKGKQPNYSVKVPKAFLEEVYAMGVRDGFEMYIESGAIRQMTIEITN